MCNESEAPQNPPRSSETAERFMIEQLKITNAAFEARSIEAFRVLTVVIAILAAYYAWLATREYSNIHTRLFCWFVVPAVIYTAGYFKHNRARERAGYARDFMRLLESTYGEEVDSGIDNKRVKGFFTFRHLKFGGKENGSKSEDKKAIYHIGRDANPIWYAVLFISAAASIGGFLGELDKARSTSTQAGVMY